MNLRKKHISLIIGAISVWYVLAGISLYRDRNHKYTDHHQYHAKNFSKHLVENASNADEAIHMLDEAQRESDNPYFEFSIHSSLENPTLWCVTATPIRNFRYVEGLRGILLRLNFRKVYYSPTATMSSKVYNTFSGSSIEPGIIVIGDQTYGSDISGIEEAVDVFEFLTSTRPHKILVQ